MTDVTKVSLTPARRRLVEVMQGIRYGRLEGLEVRDFEPVFEPPARAVRQIVFGKDNGPHTARNKDGFAPQAIGGGAVRALRPGSVALDSGACDQRRAARPHDRGGHDPALSPEAAFETAVVNGHQDGAPKTQRSLFSWAGVHG